FVAGTADLDADGDKDILYNYPADGRQYAVYLNGTAQQGGDNYVTGKTAETPISLGGQDEGTDTVQSSIGYVLPSGVENLTLASGAGNIAGTGNTYDNVIIGNEGNNILIGKGGVDVLTGNGGADTFGFADGDSAAAVGKHDL